MSVIDNIRTLLVQNLATESNGWGGGIVSFGHMLAFFFSSASVKVVELIEPIDWVQIRHLSMLASQAKA
jgi:hypothetical protein